MGCLAPVDSTKHELDVVVDKAWFEKEWLHYKTEILHYRYSDNRVNQTAKPDLHIHWTFFYRVAIRRNASKSLKRGDCLGIVEKNDVSGPLAYFLQKMTSLPGFSRFWRMYLKHRWAAVAPARYPIPPVFTYESFAT
jgi:hypothetical protein